jgi:hypothetical protein
MNNFKYQKKSKPSEEEMNSFKDFTKVIKKHNAISSAYKKVWKYSITSSVAAGILVASYLLFPSVEEHKKEVQDSVLIGLSENKTKKQITNQNIHIKPIKAIANPPEKKAMLTPIERVTSVALEKEKVVTNSDDKTEDFNNLKELQLLKSPSKSAPIFSLESTNSNSWYTLNEKPQEEIIKLPTLLVSNVAWPKRMKKTKLIKSPSITTLYESINQEIPIVNGMAYITTSFSKKKPKGHKLNGNYFPPGLIRDIHKTSKSCILLLKDIEIVVPGRGRVNIGDREIKINTDNNRIN